MFGIYRTVLAIIVVIHHLGYIPIVGHFSVHGFFILSGFLMTTIMHERYHYCFEGIKKFYVNRALRLYPQNFIMLFLSCLVVAFFGNEIASSFRSHLYMPSSVSEWAQNLSLIYFDFYPNSVSPRLLPPTWALTVELFFYVLIGLGLSKNKFLTICWCLLTVVYFLLTHLYDLPYQERYSSILAGSLGFSIGAMLYYFKDALLSKITTRSIKLPVALFAATIINMFLGALCHYFDLENAFYLFFYSNYLLNALTILSLLKVEISNGLRLADSKIGDYSYPLYLVHWPIGLVVSMVIFGRPINQFSVGSITVALVGLIAATILSYFTIRYIDKPIEKLRRKLKS